MTKTFSASKLDEPIGWIVEDSFDRGQGLRSSDINDEVSSLQQIIVTPLCKAALSSTYIVKEVNKRSADALSLLIVDDSICSEERGCLFDLNELPDDDSGEV
ncbi:hypothetical protein OROHE_025094 [Orobanche hederae]